MDHCSSAAAKCDLIKDHFCIETLCNQADTTSSAWKQRVAVNNSHARCDCSILKKLNQSKRANAEFYWVWKWYLVCTLYVPVWSHHSFVLIIWLLWEMLSEWICVFAMWHWPWWPMMHNQLGFFQKSLPNLHFPWSHLCDNALKTPGLHPITAARLC